MSGSYRDAAEALHRAPHEAWVAERKRLAAELKAAGDKAGAAQLAKLPRPPLSAWVINQLWWRAPELFAQLLAAAARSRAGDFAAAATARRDAVAALKARAAGLLVEAGHAAQEATLRRVTTTLSALAAAGGFEPDLPGMLAADRDPPGFDAPGLAEALALGASAASAGAAHESQGEGSAVQGDRPVAAAPSTLGAQREASPAAEGVTSERETAERETAEREAAEREAAERAAQARREAEAREEAERQARREQERSIRERERRRAERQRLETSLVTLRGDLERRRREVERLQSEVARVQGLAAEAQAAIDRAESELLALGPPEAEPTSRAPYDSREC